MSEIIVSVCCLAYNHKDYIQDALDSFLMQKTNFGFEILIHDDASTDGTSEIIKSYQKKYPQIVKPIFQEENMFSQGIKRINHIFNEKRAKGKYIALCEGDDYWISENKLQEQFDFMELHSDYSLCMHASLNIDSETKKIISDNFYTKKKQDVSVEEIILQKKGNIATASMFYRKKLIENIPDYFFRCVVGDYPLQLYLASVGKVYYMPQLLSAYRVRSKNSLSNRLDKMEIEQRELHYKNLQNMLSDYDKETNYKYNNSIKIRNEFYDFLIALEKNSKDIKKYKNYYFYKEYKKDNSLKLIKEKHRLIYSLYKKMKNDSK